MKEVCVCVSLCMAGLNCRESLIFFLAKLNTLPARSSNPQIARGRKPPMITGRTLRRAASLFFFFGNVPSCYSLFFNTLLQRRVNALDKQVTAAKTTYDRRKVHRLC